MARGVAGKFGRRMTDAAKRIIELTKLIWGI
jgi:hypothetical protein